MKNISKNNEENFISRTVLTRGILPILLLIVFSLLFSSTPTNAEVLKGSSFQILDPVITVSGERATSTSFTLLSAFSQFGIGTSTATTFQLNPGFLAFPVVTLPSVTATVGDSNVVLSWTTSTGKVGWNVSGYTVGQATVSGGPYSYTSVGNVTSSTRSGLSNGAEYFFVVLPEDAFSNRIATSTEVSGTPVAGAPSPTTPGTGGGGPPSFFERGKTTAVFRGLAYPRSTVTLLEDSFIRSTAIADSSGFFEIVRSGLAEGVYSFGVTARDSVGRQSRLISLSVDLPKEGTIAVPDIFLPPTLSLDVSAVRKGDPLTISGTSAARANVTVLVTSIVTPTVAVSLGATAGEDGTWSLSIDTASLLRGEYRIRASAFRDGQFSSFSSPLSIIVGDETVRIQPVRCPLRGDLNGDCRVNLVDFSIAAFYYERELPETFQEKERTVLNGDGAVDLKDFSLLAYYWTG